MQYDFVITLKRPSYKYIDVVSQLLLLLFIAAFVRYAFGFSFSQNILLQAVIPVAIIGLWMYTKIRSKERDFVPYYRLELLMAAFGWQLISWGAYWWLAVLYTVLGLCERFIKFPDELGFSKEKVTRNTFPKQHYEWVDIDNVIIRDNLFTLDLRSNKIIQKDLDEPIDKELETEFNEYCKKMLHFSLNDEPL